MGYHKITSDKSNPAAGGILIEKPKSGARLILAAVAVLGLAGYLAVQYDAVGVLQSKVFGPRETRTRQAPPPPVRVAVADVQDVPVKITTIGTVLANSIVTVRSQVDGPLLATMFKEGQMVKKGDLLFRIDPAIFETALRQAQAQEARDRAQLVSAQADADRAVVLAERNIVSTQQRVQLVANANALKATIDADVAVVDRAKLNLEWTYIRSPINGKTGPFLAFPGNQIRANDPNGLITITEIQPVRIAFNLPQGELPRLQDRLKEDKLIAHVSTRSELSAGPGGKAAASSKGIPVKIGFIGNSVDARSGTIELRATFDNPDLRFVPGELVDVDVMLETLRGAVTVPREALNIGQDGEYVFVLDSENKARMRPVNVLYQDQSIAALGTGVARGDKVIVDGQLLVSPGIAVSVVSGGGTAVAQGVEAGGETRASP
jgi:membrane fusion protein, multidrug efflux system